MILFIYSNAKFTLSKPYFDIIYFFNYVNSNIIEENFNNILTGDTSKVQQRKGIKGKYHNQVSDRDTIKNGYDISLTIDVTHQYILQDELRKIYLKTSAEAANKSAVVPGYRLARFKIFDLLSNRDA